MCNPAHNVSLCIDGTYWTFSLPFVVLAPRIPSDVDGSGRAAQFTGSMDAEVTGMSNTS